MRFVDKITKSKYFQKATETEFIKKKMEEVSNTPLLLTVELQELRGTLVVNIPPPPTDRIWYVKTVVFLCGAACGVLSVKIRKSFRGLGRLYAEVHGTCLYLSKMQQRDLFPLLRINKVFVSSVLLPSSGGYQP